MREDLEQEQLPGPVSRQVALLTLGCKINQYDTNSLIADLEFQGHTVVSNPVLAEVVVVNTCTVTGKTDYKGRQLIRRVRHENPDATVIVTGCYAQVQPRKVAAIPGVDYVLGNEEKSLISSLVGSCRRRSTPQILVGGLDRERRLEDGCPGVHSGTTRAFLKIQDGCDYACSYCIIPRARGRSRSLPPARLEEKIGLLGAKGFQEVVLCGIHLGMYGQDLDPATSLLELLTGLEREGPVSRIRISSIEPNEVKPEMVALFAGARHLCSHFHLPLQSGDPGILRAMNRRYTPSEFTSLVEAIHREIPGAAVGVDVIAGFPGETEAAFRNTCELLESLPVSYFHVFPYSHRPGTVASRLPEPVSPETIRARAEQLRSLGRGKRLAFYRGFLGAQLEVLVEGRKDRATGLSKGVTRNYLPVLLEAPESVQGARVGVEVVRVEGGRVWGRLLPGEPP